MSRKVIGSARGWPCVVLSALIASAAGCSGPSPFSIAKKGARIGVEVVGEVVHEADVDKHAQMLVNRHLSEADKVFGRPLDRVQDTSSDLLLSVYPVKNDPMGKFRWAVESRSNTIVALSKVERNPDLAKSLLKKTYLKEKLEGKTPAQVEQEKKFKKLVLVGRSQASGNMIRLYDATNVTDLMGTNYCVIEFDHANRCRDVRLVGVPASSGNR